MKTSIIAHFRSASLLLIMGISVLLFSCKGGADKADAEDADVKAQTPVTVTSVNDSSMVDYIDLNATSAFLQKSFFKANAVGYIQKLNAQIGHFVTRGKILFTIKTK